MGVPTAVPYIKDFSYTVAVIAIIVNYQAVSIFLFMYLSNPP